MISWLWFHTWNYDIIGNLKSYVLVSWNHIPCIWFQWYDVIYQYITMWYHIWNLDMLSWFHIVWFHMLYMHACMIGLTMMSWVWFYTWNYDIIGPVTWWFREIISHAYDFNNMMSYTNISWCDIIYEIWIWYHDFILYDFMCYMHACLIS